MGNTTAVRSFALSGGAAGSLLAAVAVVLVLLGAILAFNAGDRGTTGSGEQTVSISGAPEAAAQSVAPAAESVARTPQPIPEPVAAVSPEALTGPLPLPPPVTVTPPPPPPAIDPPIVDPGPPVFPQRCLLPEFANLPQCLVPDPGDDPSVSGVVGGVTGGVDGTLNGLLGTDVDLQGLTAPLGETLDELLSGAEPTLRAVVGGVNNTLGGVTYGLNNALSGLTGK